MNEQAFAAVHRVGHAHLLQHDLLCLRVFSKSRHERRRMRDHDDLCASGGLGDETPERRQQVGMQARLRLVEDHEVRRPRRQQSRYQQQIAQRTVGKLSRL